MTDRERPPSHLVVNPLLDFSAGGRGAIRSGLLPDPAGPVFQAGLSKKRSVHHTRQECAFSLEDHTPANKLPWTTLVTSGGDWGQFNREEPHEAFMARAGADLKRIGVARRWRVYRSKRNGDEGPTAGPIMKWSGSCAPLVPLAGFRPLDDSSGGLRIAREDPDLAAVGRECPDRKARHVVLIPGLETGHSYLVGPQKRMVARASNR